jgi:hypothetical protein
MNYSNLATDLEEFFPITYNYNEAYSITPDGYGYYRDDGIGDDTYYEYDSVYERGEDGYRSGFGDGFGIGGIQKYNWV